MTTLAALAGLLVLADASAGRCLDSQSDAGVAYGACVASQAQRLEVSGESPSDIATAAMGACGEARQVVIDGIQARGGSELAIAMVAKLDDIARRGAIRAVVDKRAIDRLSH